MYNHDMERRSPKPNYLLLPAVLAYLAVAVTGVMDLEEPRKRALAIGLLVVFAVLFFVPDYHHASNWLMQSKLAAETCVVAGLIYMQPNWGVFPILFFLLGPEALIRFPITIGVVWVGIFTLVTGVIFAVFIGWMGLLLLLPYAAGYLFFAIFGWTTSQAMKDRKRSEQLLAELQAAHNQLQEYTSRLEELTITQERNRIAREMHDTLGHRLTVVSVQLEGAQRLVRSNPERAEQILGTVREQIREGLGELRRTVAILRAAVEEDLPLEQALPLLARQVQEATGIQINLSLGECPEPVPAAHRQAIYRAAQEGLTNIQRHSHASEAWLQMDQRDGNLTLLVSDNGVGLTAETDHKGFGLTGLKERAALLEGEFLVVPRPGGGTQLIFRIPLPREVPYEDRACG